MIYTVVKGQSDYTDAQIDVLEDIANQCPKDGGDAVYQARAMLSTELITENICESEERANNSLWEEDHFPENILIYPNPGAEQITVELNAFGDEDQYLIEIFNLLGERILTEKTLSGTVNLNTSSFARGTYVCVVSKNGKQIHLEKIILIK